MDKYCNFKLTTAGILSKQCLNLNLTTFTDVCLFIKNLPYGRNTDRSDYTLVLKEQKGTCSTKHAFLKQLAIENKFEQLLLCVGIYRMNASNTNGVGAVLDKYNLGFILEAHTYLKHKDTILDFTSTNASLKFYDTLLYETYILPNQIGVFKLQLHHQFFKSWIEEDDVPFTFKTL